MLNVPLTSKYHNTTTTASALPGWSPSKGPCPYCCANSMRLRSKQRKFYTFDQRMKRLWDPASTRPPTGSGQGCFLGFLTGLRSLSPGSCTVVLLRLQFSAGGSSLGTPALAAAILSEFSYQSCTSAHCSELRLLLLQPSHTRTLVSGSEAKASAQVPNEHEHMRRSTWMKILTLFYYHILFLFPKNC